MDFGRVGEMVELEVYLVYLQIQKNKRIFLDYIYCIIGIETTSIAKGEIPVRTKKTAFIIITVLVLAAAAAAAFAAFSTSRTERTMTVALEAYAAQDYQNAYDLFSEISGKRTDADGYARVCRVKMYLADSDYSSASSEYLRIYPERYSAAVQKEIEGLHDGIETLRLQEKEAQEERIRAGIPYVGMSESYISQTSLGAPSSKVRHNTDMKNGQVYTANLYDFYNAEGKLVFTARCLRGVVKEVWDTRDNPVSWSGTTSGKHYVEDEYNASDYSHPEDFYDDHYDDFIDYYDAEEYWYDHYDD